MKRKKGYYSISVVAKMFSVHQQTIRMYEKEGLISPKRSDGNTRLFSEDDVDRLEEIINLTHKMGVNLAGVEMILKLQKKIKKMQDDMNKLFSQMHGQLDEETDAYKEDAKKQAQRLVDMKKEGQALLKQTGKDVYESGVEESFDNEQEHQDAHVVDDWEIEYDEDDK